MIVTTIAQFSPTAPVLPAKLTRKRDGMLKNGTTGNSDTQTIVLSDQVTSCPLCGNTDRERFYQGEHLGVSIRYWLCKTCGFVYQSPRMTEAELNSFYAMQYRKMYLGQAEPTSHDIRIQAQRASHLAITVCEDDTLSPEYHLDIGCGSGALLEAMQEICGCQSEGIEPSTAYRSYATDKDLTIYSSLDEWKASSKVCPDLVTMSHVLEHLMDPVAYLSDLRQHVLKPRGYLLIEVPNLYVHKSFELAHNFAFSPSVLREIVRKVGFRVVLLKKHGVPLKKSPLYLTLLAQSMSDPLPLYELRSNARGVKAFRKAGQFLVKLEWFFGKLVGRARRHLGKSSMQF